MGYGCCGDVRGWWFGWQGRFANRPYGLDEGHALRAALRLDASPSRGEGEVCTTSLTTNSRSDHVRLPVARPLWMDVPSAEAPAFAGMTEVAGMTVGARGWRALCSLGSRVRGNDGWWRGNDDGGGFGASWFVGLPFGVRGFLRLVGLWRLLWFGILGSR